MTSPEIKPHGWVAPEPAPRPGRRGKLTRQQLILIGQGRYRGFKPVGTQNQAGPR